MARVPQNRESVVVHTCPICGKKSDPFEGSAEDATDYLHKIGWTWTSALDGGAWHLVCQLHRKPEKPQTLYVDNSRTGDRLEKFDPEKHAQKA